MNMSNILFKFKIFRDNIRNIATDIEKVRIKNNKVVLFHDVLLKSSVRVH